MSRELCCVCYVYSRITTNASGRHVQRQHHRCRRRRICDAFLLEHTLLRECHALYTVTLCSCKLHFSEYFVI